MTAAPATAGAAGASRPTGSAPRARLWLAFGAGVVALGGTVWWLAGRSPPVTYVTAPVSRGDVATTIIASGSVNPVVTVQVGAFVSGTIQSLSCDYNTLVKQGQLCAKIDPKPYQVIVDSDTADLAVAKAQLAKDQAALVYADIARRRAARLLTEDSISRDAADVALNARDQAAAQVDLDRAAIVQKSSTLKGAKINLAYTDIVSPVRGTVVSRNVTMGQTVASSFTTPTLFLIATDLTRMQVDTNVSESDIAGAVQGAPATFTVDAFPGRVFWGRVAQVRQAPISVQNVITYDAVVTVANPDLALKPGMTATTRIVRAQASSVLRVPSQALRFSPAGAKAAKAPGARRVWVLRRGKPVAVPVEVGLDDDSFAEVRSGALGIGDPLITGESGPAKAAKTRASASTPKL